MRKSCVDVCNQMVQKPKVISEFTSGTYPWVEYFLDSRKVVTFCFRSAESRSYEALGLDSLEVILTLLHVI